MTSYQRKVRDAVCSALNRYWPDAEVKSYKLLFWVKVHFLQEYKGEHKIGSGHEYSAMAKEFSHKLRAQIKEQHQTFHGTLKVLSSGVSILCYVVILYV